jgi:hypothetical protein
MRIRSHPHMKDAVSEVDAKIKRLKPKFAWICLV